jgi:manganese/zinc/iron transport system permease protein
MLTIHLANHEGRPEAVEESRIDHLDRHLRWEPEFARRIVRLAERRGLVRAEGRLLELTQAGRELAADALAR